MRKIALCAFVLIIFLPVNQARAIIGPSVSITGSSIFSVLGESSGAFLLDGNGEIIADNDGNSLLEANGTPLDQAVLTWKPPELTNPQVITIENSETAGFIKTTIAKYPYTTQTVTETAKTSHKSITVSPATDDVEVYYPCDEQVEIAGVQIINGDDLQSIGGSLKANTVATTTLRGLTRYINQSGTVFIEGQKLDLDEQTGMDAIDFGSNTQAPTKRADIIVQNTAVINGGISAEPYHTDCIQPYGDTRTVRLDKFYGRSQLQCVFFDPQHENLQFDMRRLDVGYTDPTANASETGYTFYLHTGEPDDLLNRRRPAMTMQHVWAGQRETNYSIPEDGYWTRFSLHPRNGVDAFGWVPDVAEPNSTSATLSDYFPEVTGTVFKGPPSSSIVDIDSVGLNYVPIGYMNQI